MSASFVIRYLCTDRSVLRLRLRNIRFSGKLLWPCILLGTSPALMQLTENLVAISYNTSLQAYGGDMSVASMSILSSVMQFVMLLLPGPVSYTHLGERASPSASAGGQPPPSGPRRAGRVIPVTE